MGTLLFADVSFCDRMPGGWAVGLTVRDMRTALAELNRLERALREEQAAAAAAPAIAQKTA